MIDPSREVEPRAGGDQCDRHQPAPYRLVRQIERHLFLHVRIFPRPRRDRRRLHPFLLFEHGFTHQGFAALLQGFALGVSKVLLRADVRRGGGLEHGLAREVIVGDARARGHASNGDAQHRSAEESSGKFRDFYENSRGELESPQSSALTAVSRLCANTHTHANSGSVPDNEKRG